MNHFITKCSCGVVLAECRCPSTQKTVKVIERGCSNCHDTKNQPPIAQTEETDIENLEEEKL